VETLRRAQAAAVTGLTQRQLDHWDRSGYVVPSGSGRGQGKARSWGPVAVARLAVIRAYLDAGVELTVAVDATAPFEEMPLEAIRDGFSLVYADGNAAVVPREQAYEDLRRVVRAKSGLTKIVQIGPILDGVIENIAERFPERLPAFVPLASPTLVRQLGVGQTAPAGRSVEM